MNIIRLIKNNQSFLYTLLTLISSGINFITLIVFGRFFSVNDYGIITTTQAFLANIAIFIVPFQMMLCKTIADSSVKKIEQTKDIINLFLLINTATMCLLIISGCIVSDYLHYTNILVYLSFIILVYFYNLYYTSTGILQGKQDFLYLGWSGIILYTVKMIASIAFSKLGIGYVAVNIGFLIAAIITTLFIAVRIKTTLSEIFQDHRWSIDKAVLKWYAETFILYLVVSLYMNNGDILLGNLYCDPLEIGLYSVAANLSKISVYLIATPVATIILPKIAACEEDPGKQRSILFQAEGLTFLISVVYGLCFCLLSDKVIPLLYGTAYTGASGYVFHCVIFSTILSVFWVFYQYAYATKLANVFTVITLIIGLIEFAIITSLKISLNTIPLIMSAGMALTILFTLLSKQNR